MFERSNKFTFYLTDYLSTEDMVKAFIDKLFTNTITIEEDGTEVVRYKYDGYLIFAHNFSRFDSIFIFKLLVKYVFENGYTIEVLKRDSDFINISIKSTTHKFEINLRDSYLLLLGSLKNLAKSFKVEDKGIFPYNFVNDPSISLDYIGKIPDINLISNVEVKEYERYSKRFRNNWNLKVETVKYCLLDCKVLHQILIKFSKEIFKEFGITLKYTPTTSSLSLKTFITKFLTKNMEIPIITGDQKFIMTWGLINEPETEYSIHQNILINNQTTFKEFWNIVGPFIQDKYLTGTVSYSTTIANRFKVLVWDANQIKNKKIKLTKTASNVVTVEMSEKEFNKTNFSKSILGTTVRGYHTSTENKKLDKGRFIKPL